MKKAIALLIVLLALGAAGAFYFLKHEERAGGSTAAVNFLPADTLALLAIPDLEKIFADWKTTDLYKIWTEPEVQAFLAKPISTVPPHPEVDKYVAQIHQLALKNTFVALTALDESDNQPHLLAGFQFTGTSADVDKLLANAKTQLHQSYPAAKSDLVNYEGHSLETVETDPKSMLASTYAGNWYFVSNDLKLLKKTLDRIDHRGDEAKTASLEQNDVFGAVMAKMPLNHATLIYARLQPFMKKIFDLLQASGQAVDPAQRANAEKVQGFAATTGFEDGKMRDVVYMYAPGVSQDQATLRMDSLPLTTVDTLFYAAAVMNLPANWPAPGAGNPATSPGYGYLQGLESMLSAHDVTYADFHAAFGTEAGMQIDWPASQVQPSLILSLDVRDPVKAGKFIDNFTNALDAEGAWQTSQANGITFHSFAISQLSALAPTLAVTKKHLLLGLNTHDVGLAAGREGAATPNFTASEAYKTATAKVTKPNNSYAYVDSRAFFERSYNILKPYALLGAAFMFPKANDWVDLSKLPNTDTIAKHLSPTVFSSKIDPQGIMTESVGSFTFPQAILGVSVAGGAASVPILQKQMGALNLGKPAAHKAAPGAAPNPNLSSPQPSPGE